MGRSFFSVATLVTAAIGPLQEGGMEVTITSPQGESAVFGEVRFAAEVRADEPIDRVELSLDRRPVAVLREPPWEVLVDVGSENAPRVFSVVAFGRDGSTGTAELVTPAVEIDFEVDLSLQQLYVTATRDGEPLLYLQRGDFTVVDDGVRQELVTFEQGSVPMTIALLVDVSRSMSGSRLRAALRAARSFMRRLTELDEVFVMVFSDRIHRVTGSSTDLEESAAALEDLETGGGTALNDHLYAALRLLDQRQGRPVVILLSDGADTLSLLGIEEVLWKLRRSNAVIYRIQVEEGGGGMGAFATAWQDLGASRAELEGLARAVRDSGGRVEVLRSAEELEGALESVLKELREQYVLGYYPTEPRGEGRWRPVEVRVSRADVEVRTRAGYIDKETQPPVEGDR